MPSSTSKVHRFELETQLGDYIKRTWASVAALPCLRLRRPRRAGKLAHARPRPRRHPLLYSDADYSRQCESAEGGMGLPYEAAWGWSRLSPVGGPAAGDWSHHVRGHPIQPRGCPGLLHWPRTVDVSNPRWRSGLDRK